MSGEDPDDLFFGWSALLDGLSVSSIREVASQTLGDDVSQVVLLPGEP